MFVKTKNGFVSKLDQLLQKQRNKKSDKPKKSQAN